MTLIVCGGRDFSDRAFVFATLDAVQRKRAITLLVTGDCPTGADAFAKAWAACAGVPYRGYPADWARFGKRAGPKRNAQMYDDNPDVGGCVAFEGGRGTDDCARQGESRGVTVWRPRRI